MTCPSCGMPLRENSGPYCPHCSTPTGELKPFADVLAGLTAFLVRTQGLAPEAAATMAREGLLRQPAWRDRA